MLLHFSTWQEVEGYLKDHKGIVIPIGSTEQHGPTGLIGTDSLCPEIIALHAAKDADDVLIGPTFNVGNAQHHMGFTGSMTLRPSTMMAVVQDWVTSLRHHGFERIYFLNGHGGNNHTMRAAFAEIYAARSLEDKGANEPQVKLGMANWWELEGIFKLCKDLFPTGHGAHATPSEIAVTQFAYPETVKDAPVSPKIAPLGPVRDAEDYRSRFPDGRMGSDPTLATPELGRQIVEAASAAFLRDFKKFMAA